MTISQITEDTRNRLVPLYGRGEAEAMLRVIWESLRRWQPVDVVLHASDEAGEATIKDFRDIVTRLEKREPLQYILGEARFFGLNLKVDSHTLIPRPETEGLVQMIVDDYDSVPDLRIVDFGTGSGAIAIALARHLPFASVVGIDISDGALAVARENARNLRVDVKFVKEDILNLKPRPERFDIVVSNPPYVLDEERKTMDANVVEYEPESAIFAPEEDSVAFYRAISTFAAGSLVGGGRLYFELNPLTAEEVKRIVAADGFADVELLRDIHGRVRYLKAQKPRI